MKCPKCNSDVEMMVNVTVLAPSEMEGQFSKKNLRKKEVKIYAVNWERAAYFCRNDKCRWFMLPGR
jgi:hypothetical protein